MADNKKYIDFEKDGKPSKMVPPPTMSTEEIEAQDKARAERRKAEIKKGAAEYEADPDKYRVEHKLKALLRRGASFGGGSGGSAADRREAQLGADLDPKALMRREGMKKGGKVKSASARADGCAIRGKTRA